ncbi:hypothetical protein [Actinomadura litoris]|uniref:hypothetical protein n=1 Tax=Actinomadura litoris TaxID=2678616 RepID=UPI001FA6FFBD|nr:hypothetical protein [Actinomadura litoris]
MFTSWEEVQEYVEHDSAGQDLKAIVGLIDTYGPDLILQAVDRLSPPEHAQVTVSTAHKAKGREWESVRIGKGFDAPLADEDGIPRDLNPAEARLIYVAVSRARRLLDPEGLAWIDDYEKSRAATGRSLIGLSLTGQLKHPSSPVSQFMQTHLPDTTAIEGDYLAHLTGLPHPVQPIEVQYPDWSALGHAIDYRLRLSFGGRLGPAVHLGVLAFEEGGHFPGSPPRPVRQALLTAGHQLLAEVEAYLTDPDRRHKDIRAQEAVTRLCYVAAFFEDLTRTGHIRRNSLLGTATPTTTLADLSAMVPGHAVSDIHQQMHLAGKPLASLRALPDPAKVCGPLFAGSGDLGGADADYILDGLLLDCKATTRPRRLGREEIYQLAGYLLLDYDDHYGINRVGLYLSRQGALITWTVEDFLRRLGTTAPLPLLRRRFRSHLRAAHHQTTQER